MFQSWWTRLSAKSLIHPKNTSESTVYAERRSSSTYTLSPYCDGTQLEFICNGFPCSSQCVQTSNDNNLYWCRNMSETRNKHRKTLSDIWKPEIPNSFINVNLSFYSIQTERTIKSNWLLCVHALSNRSLIWALWLITATSGTLWSRPHLYGENIVGHLY